MSFCDLIAVAKDTALVTSQDPLPAKSTASQAHSFSKGKGKVRPHETALPAHGTRNDSLLRTWYLLAEEATAKRKAKFQSLMKQLLIAEQVETPPKERALNRQWLLQSVEKCLRNASGILSVSAIAADVLSLLRSQKANLDLQQPLVDLLGYDSFDFLEELIQNRSTIVSTIVAEASNDPRVTAALQAAETPAQKDYKPAPSVSFVSENVTTTKKERETVEQREKRVSEMLLGTLESLTIAEPKVVLEKAAPATVDGYPGVFAEQDQPTAILDAFGRAFSLPANAERFDSVDCEEIVLPVSTEPASLPDADIVPISALNENVRSAFTGYRAFNVIQSLVFHAAYGSNENMLVCAPTGAGKTDIAMLTVLRAFQSGQKDHKVVYVAPMKALAAEITQKFEKRLAFLGIRVRELTGDMPLTRLEIDETEMLVVTPEKWDVVTRKPSGNELNLALLILDEVHLLHDERGAVIESIVARTLRRVEQIQSMIRIVGLSATLPNYLDVADFLGVNRQKGLFVFDSRFRPVPLQQHIVGVKGKSSPSVDRQRFNRATFDRLESIVAAGKQVMIFVHSRKETLATARSLIDMAQSDGVLGKFDCSTHERFTLLKKQVDKARMTELGSLYERGFAVHNAGMMRSDRLLVEKLFKEQLIKVLVCTATLAWGVNLPAYAVIVKGTEVYDTARGGFVDLSILDVLQIFGRAGRPQYENRAVAYIITKHEKMQHYLRLMTSQQPLESQLAARFPENLNAEVALGNVSTVEEAVSYLKYTFYHVRLRKSPLAYGFAWADVADSTHNVLLKVATKTLENLEAAHCVHYDRASGAVTSKDIGRIASHYYLTHRTLQTWNEVLGGQMTNAEILGLVSLASEFEMIRSRPEETKELQQLTERAVCKVRGTSDTFYGKTNCLLQSYISRVQTESFALNADMLYIAQNSARLLRALFEMALSRGLAAVAQMLLNLCISVERQVWPFQSIMKQFSAELPADFIHRVSQSERASAYAISDWRDMDDAELLHYVKQKKQLAKVRSVIARFPVLSVSLAVQPISRTVGKISCKVKADFNWSASYSETFWMFCEYGSTLLYHVSFTLNAKRGFTELVFHLPLPTAESGESGDIYVYFCSASYVGCELTIPLELRKLPLPSAAETSSGFTNLEDLTPLPVSAVGDSRVQEYLEETFRFFNPIQTRIFHVLYHLVGENVLLGAPTGSGKTVAAEIAMFATWRECPEAKIVYIAPLKALVKERIRDWSQRLSGKHFPERACLEVTGDSSATSNEMETASVYITTPEKWDAITRGWRRKAFVKKVRLVIIDEIHLLGTDRGPVLEMLVSRLQRISAVSGKSIRVVGLSTALANARELSDWLGVHPSVGLFNFRHAVRSVPLDIYMSGFSGQHYCPRMNSMNKSVYSAIQQHSPLKPVLIFVSSRRQTRLTALDLIKFCSLSTNPRQFVGSANGIEAADLDHLLANVRDNALRTTLPFGIGIHHAGLVESDRILVESLFASQVVRVLVATSTLAWGVNFPAHLVVVKGTEFYDAKYQHGYVDYPLTDVLQMIGRAGRPQFDDSAVACVFVHDIKKSFYKRFLHEPFPLESSLHKVLANHLNAEVANGSIATKQDAVEFLSWTFLYRRLQHNPGFYGVEAVSETALSGSAALLDVYVSSLIEKCLDELQKALCVSVEGSAISATFFGQIASRYYLASSTVYLFAGNLASIGKSGKKAFCEALALLSRASEFDELPMRHNEDGYNQRLQAKLPYFADEYFDDRSWEDPHVKAFLLLQSHLCRLELSEYPTPDFFTDLKSVLDQAIRVAQAMIDIACELRSFSTVLVLMEMVSSIKQAQWPSASASGPNFTLATKLDGHGEARGISVTISPLSKSVSSTVKASYFPKQLPMSWWVVVTDSSNDILALKRVFSVSESSGGVCYRTRINLKALDVDVESSPIFCTAICDGYLNVTLKAAI